MAIINLDEVSDGGRPYLKKDTYSARIIEAEFTTSKAGSPMIVLQWELVAPESVDIDGNSVRIAGLQFREYWAFAERAMDITLKKMKKLHKVLNLPSSIDTDNPNVDQYAGLAADITLITEQQDMKSDDGTVIVNDDGEPVQSTNYRLVDVIRPNEGHTIS